MTLLEESVRNGLLRTRFVLFSVERSLEILGGLLSRGHDSGTCCCSVLATARYWYDTLRQ